MKFTPIEVTTEAQKNEFLDFAKRLYKDDPYWVCPLDFEINNIFNPKKNPFYQHGKAIRWIFEDQDGNTIGRVAAFINDKKANHFDVPTGGMGFFECIENREAAEYIFHTCREWLMHNKMQAMDGPINFGENDRYWGLLIDGFTHPAYGMPYNKPYYTDFFEKFGFKMYYQQVSNHLNISKPMPERFEKITQWILDKPGIHAELVTKDNLLKYGMDFLNIYNDAWQFHENFTPMTEQQVVALIDELREIMIPELICFVYVENDPAGFMICLPDLNQIIKPLKGRFGLLEKIQLWWRRRNNFEWYRKKGILNRGRVTIMGVKPKYQKYGLESALIMVPMPHARAMGFKEMELSWVGDFNPKMRKLHEATGSKLGKIHHTYRYYFDPEHEAKRSSIIAVDTKEQLIKRQAEASQSETVESTPE
jgi:GNAT superfamily N-acetyltransferase